MVFELLEAFHRGRLVAVDAVKLDTAAKILALCCRACKSNSDEIYILA
jgi:hypothetical protein